MSSGDATNNARRERSPLSNTQVSDAQVERFLREHFARVMPAEFRSPSRHENAREDSPTVLRTCPSPQRSTSRAVAGVAVAALVLIATGVLIQFPGAPAPGRRAASMSDSGTGREPAHERRLAGETPLIVLPADGNRPVEFSVTERDEPIETFRMDTEHGPVEQRSRRRVTNVSVIDPETGEKVEVELPELTIEIFPIEK